MMITGKCYITSGVDGPTNNLQDKLRTQLVLNIRNIDNHEY